MKRRFCKVMTVACAAALSGCATNPSTQTNRTSAPAASAKPAISNLNYVKFNNYNDGSNEDKLWKIVYPYGFAYYVCGRSLVNGIEKVQQGLRNQLSSNLNELCQPILNEGVNFMHRWNAMSPAYAYDVSSADNWKNTMKDVAFSMIIDSVQKGEAKDGGLYPPVYWAAFPSARKDVVDKIAEMAAAPDGAASIPEMVASSPPRPISITLDNYSKYIPFNTAMNSLLGGIGYHYIGCVKSNALRLRKGASDVNVVVDIALRECQDKKKEILSALNAWRDSKAPFKPTTSVLSDIPEILDKNARAGALAVVVKANAGEPTGHNEDWKKFDGIWEKFAKNISEY